MAHRQSLLILTAVLIVHGLQTRTTLAQSGELLPLLDAVEQFQAVWGIDVSYTTGDLLDQYTHWQRPLAQTPDQDFAHLLADTEITYTQLASGTYVLQKKPSEDTASLSGIITSAETGDSLRSVHVYVLGSEPLIGTTTDSDGHYVLSGLNPDSARIAFSHIGYASEIADVSLHAGMTSELSLAMQEWVITEMPPALIVSTAIRDLPPRLRLGATDTRTTGDLRQISGIGTADLISNLDDLSGVRVAQDNSAVHIQGGDRGEHELLLDESPVYDPVHLGLVGAFNPSAISRVTVRKAGFEATQGSYLAGVIKAEHAVAQIDTMPPVEVQLDPLSLNMRLRSSLSLGKAHVSVMGAFRTSIWDSRWSDTRSGSIDRLLLSWNTPDYFLLRASLYPLKRVFPQTYDRYVNLLADVPPPAIPDIGFNDLHVAGNINFDHGSVVKFSLYRGSNDLQGRFPIATDTSTSTPPERHAWKNQNLRLSWSLPVSARTTLVGTLRRARYGLTHDYGGLDRQNSVTAAYNIVRYDIIPTTDENQIHSTSIAASLTHEYALGSSDVGLERKYAPHRFAVLHVFPRVLEHERRSVHTVGTVQNLLRPLPWLEVTGGFRFTWLHGQKKLYSEPRLAANLETRYRGGYGASLRLSTGRYHQFTNQFEIGTISPSTIVPSTRLWLPVDETLPAPTAVHYGLDFSSQLWTYWALRVEYYYKDQQRLYRIDYPRLWRQDSAPGTQISTISEFVSLTHGKAYGTSVDFGTERNRIGFGIRYEYSVSEREYSFRNGIRRTVPVPWNVPRQIQARLRINPLRPLEISAKWRSHVGRQWAYRRAYYDLLGTDVSQGLTFDSFDFRDPTAPGHELGGFQQLDLGLAATLRFRNGAMVEFRLDVLNALDRANPAYLYLREPSFIEDAQQKLVSEARYLLERTHSFSMRLSW